MGYNSQIVVTHSIVLICSSRRNRTHSFTPHNFRFIVIILVYWVCCRCCCRRGRRRWCRCLDSTVLFFSSKRAFYLFFVLFGYYDHFFHVCLLCLSSSWSLVRWYELYLMLVLPVTTTNTNTITVAAAAALCNRLPFIFFTVTRQFFHCLLISHILCKLFYEHSVSFISVYVVHCVVLFFLLLRARRLMLSSSWILSFGWIYGP